MEPQSIYGPPLWFLWAFILIVVPFIIAKVDQWRKRGISDAVAWWDSEGMPDELRNATLFLSEENISTTNPMPMHGRVDQVYKTKNSFLGCLLIPVETKFRKKNQTYDSDIIQLSVYRVILSHQYKAPVAKYGYVRTVTKENGKDNVCYHRENLLSEEEVVKLWQHYQSIRSGELQTLCSCGGNFHN